MPIGVCVRLHPPLARFIVRLHRSLYPRLRRTFGLMVCMATARRMGAPRRPFATRRTTPSGD